MVVKAVPSCVGTVPLPNEIPKHEIENRGIAEYGVTTGRLRRKYAQIPWDLLEESVMLNGPRQIGLTFCDHFDPAVTSKRDLNKLNDNINTLICEIEGHTQITVTLVETGECF